MAATAYGRLDVPGHGCRSGRPPGRPCPCPADRRALGSVPGRPRVQRGSETHSWRACAHVMCVVCALPWRVHARSLLIPRRVTRALPPPCPTRRAEASRPAPRPRRRVDRRLREGSAVSCRLAPGCRRFVTAICRVAPSTSALSRPVLRGTVADVSGNPSEALTSTSRNLSEIQRGVSRNVEDQTEGSYHENQGTLRFSASSTYDPVPVTRIRVPLTSGPVPRTKKPPSKRGLLGEACQDHSHWSRSTT